MVIGRRSKSRNRKEPAEVPAAAEDLATTSDDVGGLEPVETGQQDVPSSELHEDNISATEGVANTSEENTMSAETVEAFGEVDAPEVDTVEEAAPAATEEKAKKEATPKRPPVPEGYITPVEFAKKLTERNKAAGQEDSEAEVKPQTIYSFIRNGSKNDPLPTYSEGGRDNLLKLEEALGWWDRKAERVAERKANAAAKAAKKDEKVAEAKAEEAAPAEDVVEAE